MREALDFYKYKEGWTNRLNLWDSLLMMNSLLEKEDMADKVQMMYFDPLYEFREGIERGRTLYVITYNNEFKLIRITEIEDYGFEYSVLEKEISSVYIIVFYRSYCNIHNNHPPVYRLAIINVSSVD